MSDGERPADWPAPRRLARGGSRTFGQMEEEAMIAAGELPGPGLPPAAPIALSELDEDEAAARLTADLPIEEEDAADGR